MRKKRKQLRPKNERQPAPAPKKRLPKYDKFTASQKAAYDRTTNLITDVRGSKGQWPELLKKHRLSSRKARESAGRDLLGGTRGKPVRAGKADRRVRDLWFPGPSGDVRTRTRSSRDATQLSDYYNDREKLLGDNMSPEEFEAKWRGVRVNGQELYSDAAGIFRMEDAGILDLDDLYSDGGPEK
jgi:hypothetical protein